jgi:hypothetical protein
MGGGPSRRRRHRLDAGPDLEPLMKLTLDIVDRQSGKPARMEVPLSAAAPEHLVRLRSVPGASALQLRLRQGDALVFAGETTLSPGETIEVALKDDPPRADCGSRPVFRLNPAQADEPSVLSPDGATAADVVFLIDGTSLQTQASAEPGAARRLLGTPEWEQLTAGWKPALAELSRRFPGGVRCVPLAFGDYPLPPVSTGGYLLHPSEPERKLRRLDPDAALDALHRLPPCSGADFVDAVAEGLEACLRVGWREDARKLVILIGDSPGYSLSDGEQEAIQLADGRCRTRDVFDQAANLHARGVELATVLLLGGLQQLEEASDAAARLVAHTRRQYQELASLPAWALSSLNLDLGSFLATWTEWKEPLARGPAPGILA